MTADRTILIFRSCSEFQSISIYKLRSQSAMAVQLIKFSSTACHKNVLRFGMGIFCDFEFRRFPKFKHLIQRNSTNFNKNPVGLNLLSRSSLYKLNHFAQKRSFHRKGWRISTILRFEQWVVIFFNVPISCAWSRVHTFAFRTHRSDSNFHVTAINLHTLHFRSAPPLRRLSWDG